VNHQPQLVDEVVLNQGLHGLCAALNHDLGIELVAQLCDSSTTSSSTVEFPTASFKV
jgi:hypothetical protein